MLSFAASGLCSRFSAHERLLSMSAAADFVGDLIEILLQQLAAR